MTEEFFQALKTCEKKARTPETYRGARRNALRRLRKNPVYGDGHCVEVGRWVGAWAFFNTPRPGALHEIGTPPAKAFLRAIPTIDPTTARLLHPGVRLPRPLKTGKQYSDSYRRL